MVVPFGYAEPLAARPGSAVLGAAAVFAKSAPMKPTQDDMDASPVGELQYIKGVPFPAAIKYRQLIVTGPPGCGKSRLVQKIRGWPEEGYIDLSLKNWWRMRALTFRPREVHLGFPFVGQDEPLTVFDRTWIEASEPLKIEYDRIQMPPPKSGLLSTDWRARYVFDFALPPAQEILAWRLARARKGTHAGDAGVTLALVERQLSVYRQAAAIFADSGILTYVRENFEGVPKIPVTAR